MSTNESSENGKASIKSMTGFARIYALNDQFGFELEIRSVNHKSLKVVCKLSEQVIHCQQLIETAIKKRIQRGSVQVNLWVRTEAKANKYKIDRNTLEKYLTDLREFSQVNGLDSPKISDLLTLPGIVTTTDGRAEIAASLWKIIKPHFESGIQQLIESRSREGAATATEFCAILEAIGTRLDSVKLKVPEVVRHYQNKLEQRIQKLLAKSEVVVDPSELAQQVAYFADRADIAEEIQRLSRHCENFMEALSSHGPVGRKLEFIAQEMLREANTMASKSSGSELFEEILEIKLNVGKLREQAANIE